MPEVAEQLHPLLRLPERIYVINLASRADRRREMAKQLMRVGLRLEQEPVELFSAIRPGAAAGFPSIGARGCFLSHLGVLTDALNRGYGCILILEDDADFTASFLAAGHDDSLVLEKSEWGIAYFGYHSPTPLAERGDAFLSVPSNLPLQATHAMLIRRSAIMRIVPYFEAMLQRDRGDEAGGPMHVDGAYSWFRRDNPDLATLAAARQWAVQRSSRTDISDHGWRERIPFINALRRWKNRLAGT